MIVMQVVFMLLALFYATLYWVTGEHDGWEALMSLKGRDRIAAGWTRIKFLCVCMLCFLDALIWPEVWGALTK